MDNHGKAWSIDHDQQLMENPDAPDSYFSSCLSRSPNAIKCRRNHLAAKMFQNDPSAPLEAHVRRMNADFAQTSLLLIEWNERRTSFKSLLDTTACKRKAADISPFFKSQRVGFQSQQTQQPKPDIPTYWHDMDDDDKIKTICQSIREEDGNLSSVFNDPQFLPCLIQHYQGFEAYTRMIQARLGSDCKK